MRSVWNLVVLFCLAIPLVHGWRVGVGSRTILPTVNGTTDYWRPIPDDNADSPGTLVIEWDVGRISVGNGDTQSHWVRDELRAYAAAMEGDDGTILIFCAAEVYMIFEPDLQVYYDLVRQSVSSDIASRLRFLAQGQHNHEGPDTSGLGGPVNRKYQEYMYNQMKDATLDAIRTLRPAILRFGEFEHWFGLGDSRDPLIVDPKVHLLRAYSINNPNGPPILTLVQWGMHPEVTLGYQPTVPDSDCIALGREPGCSARGQFFTADYPGNFRRVLQELDGSEEVIYFNGAIGAQIGNHGPVWEVSEEFPLGDGKTLPPGATEVPFNFRNAFLIGQQLAIQVAQAETPYTISSGSVEWRENYIYTQMTNPLFRIGLCPAFFGDIERPLVLGYNLRKLYTCSGEPSDETCVDDNYECDFSPLPMRVGSYARGYIYYARLGPVRFVGMPGEFVPELSIGVPRDFDLPESVPKYYAYPEVHPVGPDYTFPGTISAMLNCTTDSPCFALGLLGDEVGYVFPLSDWRLTCVFAEELCLEDHLKGAMTFPQQMSGEDCNTYSKDYEASRASLAAKYGQDTANRVISTCQWGQVTYYDSEHYEETNSGGWNAAEDYFKGLSLLMGVPIQGRYQIN